MNENEEQSNNLEKKMLIDYSYPRTDEDNFQYYIYKKKDFYKHSIPFRKKINNSDRLEQYKLKCSQDLKLSESQSLLSNFINPNTPYKGILIYWGTGVGKTCAAVSIAEKFKFMVEKYGVKIHVLVPGPLNKINFLNEIIKCTGESYLRFFEDKTIIMDEEEKNKNRKNALNIIIQYYRILSYRSFYKKVLGEKIREKIISNDKIRLSSRKNESGEYERDISVDRIYSLDNTLLIIDEAHNITGNEYGDAVKKIIQSSKNLKIILLSATPMKNLADDIVELINYLRPEDSQIERDKIFTSQKGHTMQFKPDGKEYLKKMVRGYVSYLRGADPLTFAIRTDIGEIPSELEFTKIIKCYMLEFQKSVYEIVIQKQEDSLDRTSEAVANFVFPGLSYDKSSKEEIIGYYGIEGINQIKNQLRNNNILLNKKISNTILKDMNISDSSNLLYLENNKDINGDIFNEKYLKFFSIKFYKALENINQNVYGKNGPGLIFVYSNLVKVGIELFNLVLLKNGFLEYQEILSNYNINHDTRCYFCDHVFSKHSNLPSDIPKHDFYPATFLTITGKSDDNIEQIPEEKHQLLKNVFNNIDNKDGKFIKIIVGSKVMNEGITLRNIKQIHILDVHFNLGKVDQVIGRGIRFCTHSDLINNNNLFPKVEIFKYVISIKGQITSEEELYRKAEQKYKLIKETERILQEEAIDCPLNRNGNIFVEELEKYNNCGKNKNIPCPDICGYMSCNFICGDKLLNEKFYDPINNTYIKIPIQDIDYSTYNNILSIDDIEYSKNKIKELYRLEHIYLLDDILNYVKNSYPDDKKDNFDNYYVYQALNDLIPISNNDFNLFHDVVVDKFNRNGYLIYRNKYYIFQPFDENENLPIYYRRNFKPMLTNKISLYKFIKNSSEYNNFYKNFINEDNNLNIQKYDFESVQDYYDSRNEFDYVGIIDQDFTKKKIKDYNLDNDQFKIRVKRPKILIKKRESGIPSFKGSVCKTSKDKKILFKILSKLNLNNKISYNSRNELCDIIKDKLFDLEKYSTTKDNNKLTYLIIPANHPIIPFPLNLEDRIKFILNDIQNKIKLSIKPIIDVIPQKGKYDDIKYVEYILEFDNSYDKYIDIMNSYNAIKKNNKWNIIVN